MVFFVSEDDGEVTTHQDMPVQFFDLLHKPAELWIQFRRPACKVHRRDIRFRERLYTLLHGLAGHDLFSVRPRIHMAMLTGLIAHFTEVYLKNLDPGRFERI